MVHHDGERPQLSALGFWLPLNFSKKAIFLTWHSPLACRKLKINFASQYCGTSTGSVYYTNSECGVYNGVQIAPSATVCRTPSDVWGDWSIKPESLKSIRLKHKSKDSSNGFESNFQMEEILKFKILLWKYYFRFYILLYYYVHV